MKIPWPGQGRREWREWHKDLIQAYSGDIYLALTYLAGQQGKTVEQLLNEDVRRLAEHMRGEREDARCDPTRSG